MATKLFLRNTTLNGIVDAAIADVIYDMITEAGASADTAVTNTVASGTQIQATKAAGGSTIAWISGRVPAGGFTLTQADISAWQHESNMNANIGGRMRIYKYSGGTLTEIGGGPFNDGVEMNTSTREDAWIGNVTDTALAENDRIVLIYFLTNVGTMGGGHTGTLTFNAADAATGDSFFNIAETVTFKAETTNRTLTAEGGSYSLAGVAAGLKYGRAVAVASGSYAVSGTSAGLAKGRSLTVDSGAYTLAGVAVGLTTARQLAAAAGAYTLDGTAAGLAKGRTLDATPGAYALSGAASGLAASRLLAAGQAAYVVTGGAVVLSHPYIVTAGAVAYVVTGAPADLVSSGGQPAVVYGYLPTTSSRRRRRRRREEEELSALFGARGRT